MDTMMTQGKWNVRRYSSSHREAWDAFVRESRNATFLFMRDYMDYHSDRFADCSWMAYKGEKLVALLPANIGDNKTLYSHQGLTYGGWLLPSAHINGADLIEIFEEAMREWRHLGIRNLEYKPLPYIYSAQPSEEDLYALFRIGAIQTECNLSSAISLTEPLRFNKLQKRHLAKSRDLRLVIGEDQDIVGYMSMLNACLAERHDASAVHSTEEMLLLCRRFPENISLYTVRLDGEMHAGVMIYDTGRVAHAQYIATTTHGRELNLLTPLFHWLITERYAEKAYFDFGISNEDHGRYLNEGLLRQKFSYGATGVAYMKYLVSF